MQLDRCRSCGGELERIGNSYVCKFCGSKWVIDADQDVHVIDRANAWSALRDCDFEHATELFENIIFKEPKNHEAYWGRALANAGIMYVTDFHENKKVPTCNSISESSFIDSRDVRKAIELAPADIGESYRAQAEQIEAIRSEWVKKASREPAYDVFISYKDSDREHHIERTEDSYDAQELYMALTEAGYKVFFSRVSLRNKVSEHYEPYIYNAIKTAKVMIVYGEKPEYFNAVWIKNEWMRFRKRIEIGEKHPNSLVVAYKGLDPTDLPIGLRSRQCIDASSITFLEDLKQHIEKIIREPKKAAAVKVDEPAAVASPVKPRGKKGIVIAAIAAVLAVCIGLGFVISNLAGGDGETTPVIPLDTEKTTFLPSVSETEAKTEKEMPKDTETRVEVETPRETDEVTSTDTEEETSAATQGPTGEPTLDVTDAPTEESAGAATEEMTREATDSPAEETTDTETEETTEEVTEDNLGLKYELNPDNVSYSVTGIGSCTEKNIVVPKKYKGLPVTSLADYAFSWCDDVVSITLQDSVTSIGSYAFRNCTSLVSIDIPSSLVTIGDNAFLSCESLNTVNYNGSEADWAKISMNAGNELLNNIEIIFAKGNGGSSETETETETGTETETHTHVYDNSCDASCNECGTVRTPSAHVYDNDCDSDCNTCGTVRTPSAHVYDNDCDIGCNVCGAVRDAGHVYDFSCDAECNLCGAVREADHVYNNACDSDCNVCGTTRVVPSHHYDNDCDAKCNVCEAEREVPAHVYSTDCDATCNLCFAVRVAPEEHNYLNDCATVCTGCGEGLRAIAHKYDNDCDTECNVCSETRAVIGHNYDINNKCSKCNETYVEIGIEFELQDGYYEVAKYSGTTANVIIPSTYKGLPVTSIGAYAFSSCTNLTSVVIPDSMTIIEHDAFRDCTNLTSMKTGDSVTSIGNYAFYRCTSITSMEIGDSVTSIGEYAFYYCTSLTSVEIGDSVTSIGEYAFYCCTSLTSVEIGDSVTSIGYEAFYNCTSLTSVEIGNSVTSIGSYAFTFCDSLTSVVIPDSVTSIGSYAFAYCDSLTSVVIGDSVTSIGTEAFRNCTSLTSVVIPDSVTSIGKGAFYDCTSLTSIKFRGAKEQWNNINKGSYWDKGTGSYTITYNYIPEVETENDYGLEYTLNADESSYSVTGIGECEATEIVIPKMYKGLPVTIIGSRAFKGYKLTSIVIPDSVTSIGASAFFECSSLTSVEFGDNVTSIGYDAFHGCIGLTSVTIPNSVTSIETGTFSGCSGLTSVTIPDSVTRIGTGAFWASGLTSVTFENEQGWWYSFSSSATSGKDISSSDLADPSTAATYLTSTYSNHYWYRD